MYVKCPKHGWMMFVSKKSFFASKSLKQQHEKDEIDEYEW